MESFEEKPDKNNILRIITLILLVIFIGGVAFAFFSRQGILVSHDEITEDPVNLLEHKVDLPIMGEAPELEGIVGWINTEPVTLKDLRGKVVLVDFWTYSCINCIRTFPHLETLYEKYRDSGFVLLGVHTPEFEFEKDIENVEENARENGLQYPIALDNDYGTWRAFENRYWPAHYLIDAAGNIRYTHFGEGKYAETEAAVQQLLLEAGLLSLGNIVEPQEPDPNVDFTQIGTPEIYFGALRINNFGNSVEGVFANTSHTFERPTERVFNQFYLDGTWVIQSELSEFVGDEGRITLEYRASKVNMVLDVIGKKEVLAEVKLDGEYLTDQNRGGDIFINEEGVSLTRVNEPKLYELINTGNEYETHIFEIIPLEAGFQAFTFTFG